LARPLGLALRLQRGALIGWGIAMLAFGLMYGSIVGEAQSLYEENEFVQEFLVTAGGVDLFDSFLSMVVGMLAMVTSGYAIQATLRVRGEETAGRGEPVLATAVSRVRWVGSHLAVALAGSAIVLLLAALGLGISAAFAVDDTGLLPRLLGAALAYVPVLWLTIGLAIALFGLVPRAVALAWIVLVYAATVLMLGGLLDFPQSVRNLSPFEHVPQLGADVTATPFVVLLAIATVLFAVGLGAFRRRDLQSPA
jgi:ABC-2 type transport system permease protein